LEGASVVGVEGRAVDVVRFCECAVDVSEVDTVDDIIGLVGRTLGDLARNDRNEGRVFAVRLVLEGAPGVGALLSWSPSRCLRWIRSVANTVGEGRLWIEQVRMRVGAPVYAEWALAPDDARAQADARVAV
jgi:hypothetical protein